MTCERTALVRDGGFSTARKTETYILRDISPYSEANIKCGKTPLKPLTRTLLTTL